MSKEIPEWANKATVQFIPQVVSLPTIRVQMKFPRDTEDMLELLEAWHCWKTGTRPSLFTLNELQEVNPTYPNDRVLRQVSIDLRSILFVETHYYGEIKK